MLQPHARPSQMKDECIPPVFCWTKMGAEAGQHLGAILQRKELERRAGGGVFAWGIGNSLGLNPKLAQQEIKCNEVDVLFTPMKSTAKQIDVAPSQILLWLDCLNENDEPIRLPNHMVVTSRGNSAQAKAKRFHYALICCSQDDITSACNTDAINANKARNFASLNPLGASQVTAVVRYKSDNEELPEKYYPVTFRAKLHGAGFVRLVSPVVLDEKLAALYQQLCKSVTADEWATGSAYLRLKAEEAKTRQLEQIDLIDIALAHSTKSRKRSKTSDAPFQLAL